MAYITPVNGDVLNPIGATYSPVGVTGSIVSFVGKGLSCFGISVANANAAAVNIAAETSGTGAVAAILRNGIEYNATILAYQVQNDASGYMSVIVETDAWTAATLQAQIRALGANVGPNGIDVSGTTVTNTGLCFSKTAI